MKLVRFVVAAVLLVGMAEVASRAAVAASDNPALRWHDHSAEYKVGQMNMVDGPVHTVVIGTSMAQQGLVPASGDYNAGINGGVPIVAEQWLADQVLPRLQPTQVVWALGPLDLSAVYGDATLNAYETALETSDGAMAASERAAAEWSSLVRNRTVLRDPRSMWGDEGDLALSSRRRARREIGARGERLVFDAALTPARRAEIRGRITPFALDRDDLAAIARSAAKLRAEEIQLVLVELPVPGRFVDLYPGGAEQQSVVSDAITALADELGVRIIRSSETFTDEDFVDYTHLTAAAAKRFSDDIFGQL